MSQISEIIDVNGNLIEEGKEPVHPSKLTLTEALAGKSGGTLHSLYVSYSTCQFTHKLVIHVCAAAFSHKVEIIQ